MVLLSIVEVPASLGECLAKSATDDRIYTGKSLLNVRGVPLVWVWDNTSSGFELVIRSRVADCNRKPHQGVYNVLHLRQNSPQLRVIGRSIAVAVPEVLRQFFVGRIILIFFLAVPIRMLLDNRLG